MFFVTWYIDWSALNYKQLIGSLIIQFVVWNVILASKKKYVRLGICVVWGKCLAIIDIGRH